MSRDKENAKHDDYQTRMVEVKYTPVAENYKGFPLTVSVTGEGRRTKAVLQPGVWTKCSVACAKEALSKVKRAMRRNRVQSGHNMEQYMGQPGFEQESGVMARMVEVGGEPDYEIQVRGDID